MITKCNIEIFTPFNDIEELNNWTSINCDVCKRTPCYTRRMLRLSVETNQLPIKRAQWIGCSDGKLNSVCAYRNRPNQEYSSNSEIDDNFLKNSF